MITVNCYLVGPASADIFHSLVALIRGCPQGDEKTITAINPQFVLPSSSDATDSPLHTQSQPQSQSSSSSTSTVSGLEPPPMQLQKPNLEPGIFCEGVGSVMFHHWGAETMAAAYEDSENSVVAAAIPARSSLPGPQLRILDKEAGLFPSRSLVLLSFNEDLIFNRGEPFPSFTPLVVAFNISAAKLLKHCDNSERSLKALISFVSHMGCTPTQNHTGPPYFLTHPRVAPFQQEGAVGISQMDPSTVRSMLQLAHGTSCTTVQEKALRAWVKARNWTAVKELLFSCNMCNSAIPLGKQSLDCIPPQLEGISCDTLDISGNEINDIPEWLLRARVSTVTLDKNPLKGVPQCCLRGRESYEVWNVIKLFLLFGEVPIKAPVNNRIIVVGGPQKMKAAFLRALVENKSKVTGKPNKESEGQGLIQEYKPFKLWKRSSIFTWTAWDLGGKNTDWNSFYPCLFFSDSIFMLVFDASLDSVRADPKQHLALPKLHFWLNHINSCHMSKRTRVGYNLALKPKVVVVGFYKDSSRKNASFLKGLFPAITSHWEANINFCGFFAVNLADGSGYTFRREYPDGQFRPSIISLDVVDAFERNASSPMYVPPGWVKLQGLLGTVKNPALTWPQLVRLAHKCGVGRITAKRSKIKQEEELERCFDWLSDMGSIFHFRHSLFGQSGSQGMAAGNNQIVILQPSWFNEVMTSTFAKSVNIAPTGSGFFTTFQRTTKSDLELYKNLGMLMKIHEKPQASFFLLPDPTPNLPSIFSNLGTTEKANIVKTHGCLLYFGFFPVEAFADVLSSLCNVPGVVPSSFWRNGILVSRTASDEGATTFHLLMNRVVDKVTQDTKVEVVMRTICLEGKKITWKDSLMTVALNLLHSKAQSSINSLAVTPLFLCPRCLTESLSSTPEWGVRSSIDSGIHSYFSHKELMETVMTSGARNVTCLKHPHELVPGEVAPEDLFQPLTVLKSSTVKKVKETVLRSGCILDRNIDEPNQVVNVMAELLPEANMLRNVQNNPNVTQFFGVGVRGATLLGMSEDLPPLKLAPHLVPRTGSPKQVRSLAELLEVLCVDPENQGTLNDVLPMRLREKILGNVAQGLYNLHKHCPTFIHGDIHVGNVLITSLDAEGQGPWAKIAHRVISAGSTAGPTEPISTAANVESTIRNKSPEAVRGNTLPSTQGDVWDFGILVHNVVAPLSFVDLKSTSSSRSQPAPIIQGKTITALEGGHFRVERFQVGHALASGCFVVDCGTAPSAKVTATCSAKSTPAETESNEKSTAAAEMPLWARQIISCCLVADPSQRPSMASIIRFQGYLTSAN
ncbi:hypothetical protein Pelo_16473 [Pelomyxa schiedti]|nr:hypothetical protein Pelo_16473 [Pelomyxa schiedti]